MKEYSKKQLIIRGILSAVFFIAAIVIGVRAVQKLTKKDPGIYVIDAQIDKSANLYASGIKLSYYLDGKSSDIRTNEKAISQIYSIALARAYKLTDPYNEYEGYLNLCTINKSKGSDVKISQELYDILKDAYDKTKENKGYSMFAGPYYEHFNEIIYSDDSVEFDPAVNEEESERLNALLDETLDLNNFTLDLSQEKTVNFSVSKSYEDFLKDNEEKDAAIDLNLLREAYMVRIVSDALTSAGYTKGLITTQSGIIIDLGSYERGGYTLYAMEGGEIATKKVVELKPGTSMSGMVSFALQGDLRGYSEIKKGSDTIYRSPYVLLKENGLYTMVKSSYVAIDSLDILKAVYANIVLASCDSKDAAKSNMNELGITEYYFFE